MNPAQVFNLVIAVFLIAVALYFLFYIIKHTPNIVRKISLFLFIISILLIEIVLRWNGATPGFTTSSGYRYQAVTIIPKDSLIENPIMTCDSDGINKFNLNCNLPSIHPLNKDGFRSAFEFSKTTIDAEHSHGKKVHFFIGDSWTYGLNADSGYSFASILNRADEYTVFNAGIPGADLPQYKAIVRNYILNGKLKPDRVVVCISRNDLDNRPNRKLTPGILWQFCTNAGGFNSYFPDQDTTIGDAKSAYAYLLDRYTVVGILGEGLMSKIISKSVIASRFLGWITSYKCVHNMIFCFPNTAQNQLNKYLDCKDPTDENIQGIKNDCDSVKIPILFILLPSKFAFDEKAPPQIKHVISLDAHLLLPSNYPEGLDDHPDNEGHRKLAVAIKKILDEK